MNGIDLLFVATGDANLELRLNQHFGQQFPRIHVWVDPHDTGGHALLTGLAANRGCLHCLYQQSEGTSLHNRASFIAPGQDLTITLGGCSDRFLPFSGLTASRAAIEAVRLGVTVLEGATTTSSLLSWYEGDRELRARGFEPSKRTALFSPGERKVLMRFGDENCTVCSGWTT
jgi:hypothetical protein